jgi:peroxiredoxin
MKKITGLAILMISFISLNAQGLKVTGTLKNLPNNTEVTLLDGVTNQEIGKGNAMGGNFSIAGKASYVSLYVLSFKGMQQKIPVFIGNDNVDVSGDINEVNKIKCNGSASHDIYMDYMTVITPLIEPYIRTASAIQSENDAANKDSLSTAAAALGKNVTDAFLQLTTKYQQSSVSTFFLLQMANFFPAIKADMLNIYGSFSGEAKKGPFAEVFEKAAQTAEIGKVGSVLPEFAQNDVNGKLVSLSSLRGKYVLIDFWASWCGPCRAENPNVVKAYNAYKSKGFTVLGVSLDQDKTKWLAAIKKDGLTWTHVSDLKYWNNAVAVQFGIQSIPANFLIDPNGVVIGKDLRGEDLERALATAVK